MERKQQIEDESEESLDEQIRRLTELTHNQQVFINVLEIKEKKQINNIKKQIKILPDLFQQSQQTLNFLKIIDKPFQKQIFQNQENIKIDIQQSQKEKEQTKEKEVLHGQLIIQIKQISKSLKKYEQIRKKLQSEFEVLQDHTKQSQEISTKRSKEIENIKNKIDEITNNLHTYIEKKRKLNNDLQELKGNIRVYCRVKPCFEDLKESQLIDVEKDTTLILNVPPLYLRSKNDVSQYKYQFEHIYNQQANQNMIFDELSQLIQSAIDGYNVCIFAYGQTGSGKTYTMVGDMENQSDQSQGLVFRAVQMIFKYIKELKKLGWQYDVFASFTEIYNESVRCLVTKEQDNVQISPVEDEKMVYEFVKIAINNRIVYGTAVNEHSSRSHFLIQFKIKATKNQSVLEGSLNLIDLAGSERLSQTHAEGDRLKETKAINLSLSSLSDVITALSKGDKHIPYRNSKLTYLLQDYLGGNSKTLMIVNVSALKKDFQQTICSLRFAETVQNCKPTKIISKTINSTESLQTPSKNLLSNTFLDNFEIKQ